MSWESSTIKLLKTLTGATWFFLGVVLTIVLYPLFTTEIHSEFSSLEIVNETSETIFASVFLTDGNAVSKSVHKGSESFLIYHKGEFTDDDFPNTIRVQISDITESMILNQEFSISTSGTTMISRPISFTVDEGKTDGELVKTVAFEIQGEATP